MLERFRSGVKLKSLFLQSGDNNQSGDRRFPMSEGEVDVPFILTRRLARVRTAAIRDYGRAHGATLNDLAMTALYRCLFRLLDLSSFPLFRGACLCRKTGPHFSKTRSTPTSACGACRS